MQRWKVRLGSQGVPAAIELMGEVTAPETITYVSATRLVALSGIQAATAVRLADGTLSEGTGLGNTIAAAQSEDGKLQLWRYRVTDS